MKFYVESHHPLTGKNEGKVTIKSQCGWQMLANGHLDKGFIDPWSYFYFFQNGKPSIYSQLSISLQH